MALEKCSECGNEVSSTARSCPKCGRDFYPHTNALNVPVQIAIGVVVAIILVAAVAVLVPDVRIWLNRIFSGG